MTWKTEAKGVISRNFWSHYAKAPKGVRVKSSLLAIVPVKDCLGSGFHGLAFDSHCQTQRQDP